MTSPPSAPAAASSRRTHQHVCLAYEERAVADDHMAAFIEDGLAHDEQARYVAEGPLDALASRLRRHIHDLDVIDAFRFALDQTDLRPASDELVLDAEQLTYLDHRGVAALDQLADRAGTTDVLRTGNAVPQRIVGLLQPRGVRLQPPEGCSVVP